MKSDSQALTLRRQVPSEGSADGLEETIQGVLDLLPVTDTIYHHLAFTRPLVDGLARAVREATPAGRVLIIGPNDLLPQALLKLGYEVDLWIVNGLPLSSVNFPLASRRGPLDEILLAAPERQADVVVIPYAAEASELEPAALLQRLADSVRRGGYLILASRQPGDLRRRVRRALRKIRGTAPPDDAFPPSPTWPALPARRLLRKQDWATVCEGQFRMVRSRFVNDQRAHITTEALGVWRWLLKGGLHFAKASVPGFRGCVVVTLLRSG
jgi:hypothetical protein